MALGDKETIEDIKERRSRPNRETWKESGLHIESGQITALRTIRAAYDLL